MFVYTLEQNNAGKWVYDRPTEDADFGKKNKIIFSNEAHFNLGGIMRFQYKAVSRARL